MPSKVKVSLKCTTKYGDGKPATLPAKKIRIEHPITCVVGGSAAAAGLKAVARTTEGKTPKGAANGVLGSDGNWTTTLEVDKHFTSCVNFAIAAQVQGPDGKVLGQASLKVSQYCPD